MMARRLIIALVFALLISGLFTFWLSRKFAKPHGTAMVKQQYISASDNLEAGQILKPQNIRLIEWPATSPLQGAFVKPEDVVGRAVLYPLAAGEPILDRQLSAPGAGTGLSVKIPDGMRAISLRSDQVVGVAGFLLPGTHVDVLVTYHANGSAEPFTSTVLQDVEILAAGQKTQPDPEGKPSTVDVVTLLVKPQDAERAVLASAQGSVYFVLRNGSDRKQVSDAPMRMSELTGAAKTPKASASSNSRRRLAASRKAYNVLTLSGTKVTVDTFN